MQAVPSGSGRISLSALQDQQQPVTSSPGSDASGKALITAALSKMGVSATPSAKVPSALPVPYKHQELKWSNVYAELRRL